MTIYEHPAPVKGRFFTRGTIVLAIIAFAGVGGYLYRLFAGLGTVTNLTGPTGGPR